MFPLTLRNKKGGELTYEEIDNNFKHVMFPPFLHIQDQKPQGTNGGTFTSGAWQTRDLNTVLTNTITGASLADNQITLPAGKYYVEASAAATMVRVHKTRLYNITDTNESVSGLQVNAHEIGYVNNTAPLNGIFDISAEKTFELQHRCLNTKTTTGFGNASDFTTEVYSDIRIWRIGEIDW